LCLVLIFMLSVQMLNRTFLHLCGYIPLQKRRYAKEQPCRLYRVITSQLRGGVLQFPSTLCGLKVPECVSLLQDHGDHNARPVC
jgi:hypothetical protein